MTPVWVAIAGVPYGARLGAPADSIGDFWLNVCVIGQHLPQMFAALDINSSLTAERAMELGLCPDCLGFGTKAEIPLDKRYTTEDVPERCGPCGGTGRPYVRVRPERADGYVAATVAVMPHAPLEGGYDGNGPFCLACCEPIASMPHILLASWD